MTGNHFRHFNKKKKMQKVKLNSLIFIYKSIIVIYFTYFLHVQILAVSSQKNIPFRRLLITQRNCVWSVEIASQIEVYEGLFLSVILLC